MRKARSIAIATAFALLTSASLGSSYAATAHNSQAGAYGPSNVAAPIQNSKSARKR